MMSKTSITDIYEINGLNEQYILGCLGRLRQLGVEAAILHPREKVLCFLWRRVYFITITIKRALENDRRQYYDQHQHVGSVHIPIALESRFTRQVLQCYNDDLMNNNRIKHKNLKPGAGSYEN